MKALILLVLVPSLAQAAVSLKSPGTAGDVTFVAVGHPSMLKIHGKADGPKGSFQVADDKLSGQAEVQMDKFATGIELRDKHMKEKYLEVGANPLAVITVKNAPVDAGFEQSLTNAGEKPFEGTLKFHGKEQPVKGNFTAKAGKVDAKFQIKLTDYGVAVPTYLGATVADTVDVEVNLPLQKE